jgi:hypothetical protein
MRENAFQCDWPCTANPWGVYIIAPDGVWSLPAPTDYVPIRITDVILDGVAVLSEWPELPAFAMLDVFSTTDESMDFAGAF